MQPCPYPSRADHASSHVFCYLQRPILSQEKPLSVLPADFYLDVCVKYQFWRQTDCFTCVPLLSFNSSQSRLTFNLRIYESWLQVHGKQKDKKAAVRLDRIQNGETTAPITSRRGTTSEDSRLPVFLTLSFHSQTKSASRQRLFPAVRCLNWQRRQISSISLQGEQ